MSKGKPPAFSPQKKQTIERMVDQYQTALLCTCYLYLGDRALAEDAVQETFFKAYLNLDGFHGACSEKTWLMKIAVNICHDMRKTNWFRHVDRRVTPEMLPEASVSYEPLGQELIVAVMNLPPKLRETVLLCYYQDMDTNEIAEALGISRSSVSDRLLRARRKLRNQLEGRVIS